MARARNIKPALFKNEVLGVADPLFTLMFEGLWLLADRAGRLEDRPLRIKGELFPYRDGLNTDAILAWLASEGFINRYEVGGKRYIEICNFEKHQNPHKNEPESEIPAPSMGCIGTDNIGTASEKIGITPADSLSLDSRYLIPDPLNQPAPPPGDDLFAKFWKLYPKKASKKDAEKAWAKLKVTPGLYARIVESLAKHCISKDWTKDGGQFVPHPATWLNGRRWEDELPMHENVHPIPQTRHSGFAGRDYTDGLTKREDGSYAL